MPPEPDHPATWDCLMQLGLGAVDGFYCATCGFHCQQNYAVVYLPEEVAPTRPQSACICVPCQGFLTQRQLYTPAVVHALSTVLFQRIGKHDRIAREFQHFVEDTETAYTRH